MTNTDRNSMTAIVLSIIFAFFVTSSELLAESLRPLDASSLALRLNETIDDHEAARQTAISLKVVDLSDGRVLFDRRGDQLMTPASNLKIYTTACAIDTFGPDHRFKTKVRLDGSFVDGTLSGNVVLVGGGDAMLTTGQLREIASKLVREYSLKKVEGAVVVDNDRYAAGFKGPGWMWDDDPYYFNMSVTPLMLDFNVLTVEVSASTDGKSHVRLVPETTWPPLRVVDDHRESKLRVSRRPFSEAIVVAGAQLATKETKHRVTMHDPGRWVAAVFRQLLIDEGVSVGTSKLASAREGVPVELSFPGATLAATLKHFNEESENAVGEVLLHELAIAAGIGRPTWKDGATTISKWLQQQAGLRAGSFRLEDGSGLSRYNLISADSSTRLIAFMNQHKSAETFISSLPTYDVDLARVDWPTPLSKTAGVGLVRAKGGSMSGVSTCSGILQTLGGRRLAFSYLTNGFIGRSDAQKDLRASIWAVLACYRP